MARFSLRWLFLLVLVVALFLAAMNNANEYWLAALTALRICFVAACLAGCFLDERYRPFCITVSCLVLVQSIQAAGGFYFMNDAAPADVVAEAFRPPGSNYYVSQVLRAAVMLVAWCLFGVGCCWAVARARK